MKRTKGKPRETSDEITGYLLQIGGTREDAKRAADEWGVRIRVIEELEKDDEVFAVCPADDLKEIIAWHNECMPRMQAGKKPHPGDLMRVEQPPEDVDTTFTEQKRPIGIRFRRSVRRSRPRPGSLPRHHRPLKITNSRKIRFGKL
jgi:hypothetical protein